MQIPPKNIYLMAAMKEVAADRALKRFLIDYCNNINCHRYKYNSHQINRFSNNSMMIGYCDG